jgi:hypothetical protein
MSDARTSNQVLDQVKKSLNLHARGILTDRELAYMLVEILATAESFNPVLVNDVVTMVPGSAVSALNSLTEKILQPDANWVPAVIGRPPDGWQERMIPLSRRIAVLYQQALNPIRTSRSQVPGSDPDSRESSN